MPRCARAFAFALLPIIACSGGSPTATDAVGLGGSAGATTAGTAGSGGSAAPPAQPGGAAGHTAGAATGGGGTAGSGGSSAVAGGSGSGGAAGSAAAAGLGGAGGSGNNQAGAGGKQALPTSDDFVCSWVLGITTTGEWYKAGFEDVVDDARWQVTPIEMGHLEKWADPQHEIWDSEIQSPCAKHSTTPERIVFNATKYEWTTVAEFVPAYEAVVHNIQAKYPSVQRIDLITYARGPGNVECVGANRSSYSYIKPAQDDAAAMLPGTFPGFVFVAPPWEHASCSDFGLCPHVSDSANAALAEVIGAYFLLH